MAENTVVQPDLSVVCKPFNNNNYLEFPPALVVEILSPSTAQKDRREKYAIYETQKVKYYLIVDRGFKKIEIFELLENHYTPGIVNPSSYSFLLNENCPVDINFTDLFDD